MRVLVAAALALGLLRAVAAAAPPLDGGAAAELSRGARGTRDGPRRRLPEADNKDGGGPGGGGGGDVATSAPTAEPTAPPRLTPSPTTSPVALGHPPGQPTTGPPSAAPTPAGAPAVVPLLPFTVTVAVRRDRGLKEEKDDSTSDATAAALEAGLQDYLYQGFADAYGDMEAVDLAAVPNTAGSAAVFRMDGAASFRDGGVPPPASDLQGLQAALLAPENLDRINEAVRDESGDTAVTIDAITMGDAPTPAPEPSHTSSGAAVGGALVAAVVVLTVGVLALRHARHSDAKPPHKSLEDELSVASRRSTEMPTYDLEVQAQGSHMVIITTTTTDAGTTVDNRSNGEGKQHLFQQMYLQAKKLKTRISSSLSATAVPAAAATPEGQRRDDDNDTYNEDAYSLASYKKNQGATVPPNLVLDPAPKGPSAFAPVTFRSFSPTSSSERSAPSPPYAGSDPGSDDESLFTDGPRQKHSVQKALRTILAGGGNGTGTGNRAKSPEPSFLRVVSVVTPERPAPESPPPPPPPPQRAPRDPVRTVSTNTNASRTVLHANTAPVLGRAADRMVLGPAATNAAADVDVDSDAEFDEIMGPMKQLFTPGKSGKSGKSRTTNKPAIIDLTRGPSLADDASQPSDEALDEQDRDLSGFALELEAARNGNLKKHRSSRRNQR